MGGRGCSTEGGNDARVSERRFEFCSVKEKLHQSYTDKEDFIQGSCNRGERLNKRQGGRLVKCSEGAGGRTLEEVRREADQCDLALCVG